MLEPQVQRLSRSSGPARRGADPVPVAVTAYVVDTGTPAVARPAAGGAKSDR